MFLGIWAKIHAGMRRMWKLHTGRPAPKIEPMTPAKHCLLHAKKRKKKSTVTTILFVLIHNSTSYSLSPQLNSVLTTWSTRRAVLLAWTRAHTRILVLCVRNTEWMAASAPLVSPAFLPLDFNDIYISIQVHANVRKSHFLQFFYTFQALCLMTFLWEAALINRSVSAGMEESITRVRATNKTKRYGRWNVQSCNITHAAWSCV